MSRDVGLKPDRYTQDIARQALEIAKGAAGALAVTFDELLVGWAESGSYQAMSVVLDADQVASSAAVVWPDGSAGVLTRTAKSDAWLAVDAYTISHTDSGKTVTQAAVSRDADGNVTTKPALSVA